jgi:pterin-4a-carbinolamine dehydratase
MKPTASSARFDSAISGKRLPSCSKVGELADSEGHHPDISFGWGRATVSLSTKKIKGLHENDFIMASKIDRMADRPGPISTGTPP